MEKPEKITFIINRLDHYIESTNSKANFLLALNAVIIGALLNNYFTNPKICNSTFQICVFVTLFTGFVSFIFTILAILPYTNSENTKNTKSLFFFNDIICYRREDYVQFLKNQDVEAEFFDLASQAHDISKGLSRKFSFVKWCIFR